MSNIAEGSGCHCAPRKAIAVRVRPRKPMTINLTGEPLVIDRVFTARGRVMVVLSSGVASVTRKAKNNSVDS